MSCSLKKITKLTGRAIKKSYSSKFVNWLITVLPGIISYCILTFTDNKIEQKLIVFISVVLIVLIFIGFLIYYFVKEYRIQCGLSKKDSAYGEAIKLLKESFAEAHFYRKTPEYDDHAFMSSMIVFCDKLMEIYNKITNTKCSVSIKVPIKDEAVNASTVLKNLTRDKKHPERDNETYKNIEHTILGNTPFTNCLNNVMKNNKKKYYIGNDVNNEKDYLNTSKPAHENHILPYNSELVFPITPIRTLNNKNRDCIGFICVDSESVNAFNERYMPDILEGVADGIYDMIEQNNKQNNDESDESASN